MKRSRQILIPAVIVAALGVTFGLGWYAGRHTGHAPSTTPTPTSERKVLYWHDPMVPGTKFDKPGKSPYMDMDLVPVYADESSDNAGGPPIVSVRPEIMNSLGVRTAPVARAKNGRLAIPREALIRTGTRTAVIKALGDGRFQPLDVVAGADVGDHIEIASGLKENDRVVVSGQFLIDSEANARASFSRMEPNTEHDHGGKKP